MLTLVAGFAVLFAIVVWRIPRQQRHGVEIMVQRHPGIMRLLTNPRVEWHSVVGHSHGYELMLKPTLRDGEPAVSIMGLDEVPGGRWEVDATLDGAIRGLDGTLPAPERARAAINRLVELGATEVEVRSTGHLEAEDVPLLGGDEDALHAALDAIVELLRACGARPSSS